MLLDHLVIGSSVTAATYAFLSGGYFLSTREDPPMFYRELTIPVLNCKTEPQAWNRLLYFLSLLGRRLCKDEDTIARIRDNRLTYTVESSVQKVKFNKCTIFFKNQMCAVFI